MEEYVKIAVLDNEIEARLVDSILTQNSIPHVMTSHHDTAYDGLYQLHSGWGHIEAPETYRDEILEIIEEVRKEQG